MLTELHLKRVGPAPQFDVKIGERLKIFTGDNGLGKTFLLDVIWYSLTGTWVDNPAFPQLTEETPQICCKFINQTTGESKTFLRSFDFEVPPEQRQRADFTLQRLRLRDDERVIRQRQQWYQLYLDGDLTLEGLEKKAPLIARAVRKHQQS
ncbi:hypothetical protein [Microseira sp. BLCC-F43]|jgi:DNA repair ATPase RecN|uniref:hypothetical protein n=1 Tax=Microseira sp. BLCC-F43 TaxID=3153602 RepID=UPI0035B847F7